MPYFRLYCTRFRVRVRVRVRFRVRVRDSYLLRCSLYAILPLLLYQGVPSRWKPRYNLRSRLGIGIGLGLWLGLEYGRLGLELG
jgi:hypothetical protein